MTTHIDTFSTHIRGLLTVQDLDTGELLLDKYPNAVHPQNMARMIARALAGEPNCYIYRMAFGNGATDDGGITFKTPNDGQSPDVRTWNSRLYNEVYSEVCVLSSPENGQDLGSVDNGVQRTGGGAVPSGDDQPNSVVSSDLGIVSNVVVTVTLNANEPNQQYVFDPDSPPQDYALEFNELGLYSVGKQPNATSGYQLVDVGNKNATDIVTLDVGQYTLTLDVDGTTRNVVINVTTSDPTYEELCDMINDQATDFKATITGYQGVETFGFLRFQSTLTTGPLSTIDIDVTSTLIEQIQIAVRDPVPGASAGVRNDQTTPGNESERLLTHLIFSPIRKEAGRRLKFTYELQVYVERTTH